MLVLLAAEGLLWLSERFRWFPFNQHKGYAVLIAVASVGVFFLLMLLWFLAALLFRWRFQFSILSLLLLPLVVAIPCTWLAEARTQRVAAEGIRNAGGEVVYDYELDALADQLRRERIWPGKAIPVAKPPRLTWLRKVLGEDLFADVIWVSLDNSAVSDAGMADLEGLPHLQNLVLRGLEVTDAKLEHLEGLTDLQHLVLEDVKVTDAGLEHLKGLTQLRWLFLSGTKVSDAGLENLKGLTHLERLDLSSTRVSDAGLGHLKALTKLAVLELKNTGVTGVGLEQLNGLPQLRSLVLSDTEISDAGLQHLEGLTQLHGLLLECNQVSDVGLEHLKRLRRLQWLDLRGTKVTDAGVEKLHKALPNCAIHY